MASLPAWHRAFALFRTADGATSAVIPLLAVVVYGYPAWGVALVAAVMNAAGVPASYLWGALMENGPGRRRLATMGFAMAAASLAYLATLPPWPLYLAGAAVFTAFGTATAPAAGRLVLEDRARGDWARSTSQLNAVLSWTYLVGTVAVVAWALMGTLRPDVLFAVTGVLSLAAAAVAWVTIRPWHAGMPSLAAAPEPQDMRRFERPVWFPGKLRFRLYWPRRPGPHQSLAVGVALLFFGTTTFLSTYAGVLARDLGLGTGLVLLAQAPSHLSIPVAFAMCGGLIGRWGEVGVARTGLLLRLLTVPLFMATLLWWQPPFYALVLAFGLLLGFGFALFQSTIPCVLAATHPRSAGRGVGGYHAAVAFGVLGGSSAGFAIVRLFGLEASYVVALVAMAGGTAVVWMLLGRLTATVKSERAT